MKIHFCWLVTPAIPCRSGALIIRELTEPHPDLSAAHHSDSFPQVVPTDGSGESISVVGDVTFVTHGTGVSNSTATISDFLRRLPSIIYVMLNK